MRYQIHKDLLSTKDYYLKLDTVLDKSTYFMPNLIKVLYEEDMRMIDTSISNSSIIFDYNSIEELKESNPEVFI